MKIVFTKSSGFVAWAIRNITGGEASHVALELDDGTFLQADQGGVQISNLTSFLNNGQRKIIAEFEPKPETLKYLDISWGMSKIGSEYDYLGLVGDVLPLFSWRWFHLKMGDPFESVSKFWCSRFIAELDTQGKIPEFQQIDPRIVTPVQLLKAMQKGNSFTKIL